MLNKKEINKWVNYWIESSKEKLKTMQSLYKSKRYSDSLFFGHLILEKALKAHVVQTTKEIAPKIHNLIILADICKIELNPEELQLLKIANRFNMAARYPDEKLNFYKICDKKYTDEYYQPIIKLYKKLCQKIK